jgi:hypothetical protein
LAAGTQLFIKNGGQARARPQSRKKAIQGEVSAEASFDFLPVLDLQPPEKV